MAYRKGELYHYNKNHHPRNGQFTSGPGGASTAVAASRDPKFDDPDYHSYYQDDEVWAKAEGVIYDKVIPKLNGAVRDDDDPELADITAMELADYFYSEYKNYVHDHPEEKGRVDDYVEYVKANATKVDPSFTVRDENNNDAPKESQEKLGGRSDLPGDRPGVTLSSKQFGALDNMDRRKEIVSSRDFSIDPGDSAGLAKIISKAETYPKKKLFESEEAFSQRRRNEFDDRLGAATMYTDTSRIKDTKQKAEIESRIFREASRQVSDVGRYEGGAIRAALSDRIKSCDSYHEAAYLGFSRLKPDGGSKTYNDILSYVRKNVSDDYKASVPKVLKEMGYENTQEGRDYVNEYLIDEIADLIKHGK